MLKFYFYLEFLIWKNIIIYKIIDIKFWETLYWTFLIKYLKFFLASNILVNKIKNIIRKNKII